jgi:protein-L-isoaspartate O-methyltransferase
VGERQAYALGSERPEIARLDGQAALYSEPTLHLLRSAGIGPGMRVLDLGTGLGHVAQLVADLVGPEGEVIGVDAEPALLEVAKSRSRDAVARTCTSSRPMCATTGTTGYSTRSSGA